MSGGRLARLRARAKGAERYCRRSLALAPRETCPCEILVVQSAQNRHRQRATDSLDQCRKRRRNQPRQPDEQQAIGVIEGRSLWRLAPEHVDLLAKNQDLRFTPRAGLEQSNERTTKQSEQLDHRATASPDSHRFASYMEFPTGTPLGARAAAAQHRISQ